MLLEAEIWTVARTDKGNAVLVRPIHSDQVVPIFIGQLEAQSILIGLGNVAMPRPLTHDLFGSLLKSLSARLLRVEIVELHEGTYFSNLVIQEGKHSLTVDSRPSDAIGLAVRSGCPVFISEDIVEEVGVSTALIIEENPHMKDSHLMHASEMFEDEFDGLEEFDDHDAHELIDEHQAPRKSLRDNLQEQLARAVDEENYEEAARIRDRLAALK
ncbi:bifunctional nuclease family protein [Spirochaeta dissipatitropha]